MEKYRELMADEIEALQAFADWHVKRSKPQRRNWKDELAFYWYNARIWEGPKPNMGNILHGIRNEFGPSWLYDECKIKGAK
jgi:hypothetical protein